MAKKKEEKTTKKATSTKKAASTKKVVKDNAIAKEKVAAEKAKEIEEMKEVKVEKPVKKERPKIHYAKTEEQKEMTRFFIVLLIVVLMVTGIYFLTRIFVTKDLGKKKAADATEEVVEGNVNYSVASVGQILNRPYTSYYVLVYDTKGDAATDAQSILINYNMKEERKHVYSVDLSNYLNKDFYDKENENPNAKSVDDFKFGDLTLLYIKDGKVNKYITDIAQMKKELGIN